LTGALHAAPKPNILLIYLDDFGWKDASYMGSDFYETPNLDKLARGGMVFTDAYANAANCAPSRASLLCGQYTPRHRVFSVGTKLRGNPKHSRLKHIPGTDTLDPGVATWAQVLRSTGYRTGLFGKWHLSNDPKPYGFDVNIGGTHGGEPAEAPEARVGEKAKILDEAAEGQNRENYKKRPHFRKPKRDRDQCDEEGGAGGPVKEGPPL
jgi:arylsulfatase A-like enzyme